MAEKIPQHMHCQICGKAVASTETICSDECKTKYNGMMRKRKFYVYIMWALIFVVIFLFIIGSYLQ